MFQHFPAHHAHGATKHDALTIVTMLHLRKRATRPIAMVVIQKVHIGNNVFLLNYLTQLLVYNFSITAQKVCTLSSFWCCRLRWGVLFSAIGFWKWSYKSSRSSLGLVVSFIVVMGNLKIKRKRTPCHPPKLEEDCPNGY
jgi:hypothetical protein